MYLIDTTTYLPHRFSKGDIPSYAILSHVWSDHEQKSRQSRFAKGQDGRKRGGPLARAMGLVRHPPSPKLKGACKKAREDGFRWLWTDTDCIDTSNSAELSEAINSMFVWYRDAAMCYAYLHDVPSGEDPHRPQSSFRRSRWFKRTWTLQELIAPASIIFLSTNWQPIGAKRNLADLIESITGIDRLVLTHKRPLEDISIACRMSWAASREARREEDRAYSLMGIFGVHLSTIYGEGNHAFVRLQEEILKHTSDQSIFAWG
ncbi:HET-domain-containing protein, partial [Cubamyces sp. BRFM 1775]